MERLLVAFEAPHDVSGEDYETKWDSWVRDLQRRGLQLVNDLDPVATISDIRIYEVHEAVAYCG